MNYHYQQQETALNKARRIIFTLLATLGCLIGLFVYLGLQNKPQPQITVIKHLVENGLHNIQFSYIDTAALDGLSDQEYKAFVNKGVLPSK